ncbi:DivIVA domain-containing protein [Propionicimonas paludicola]|uniref:DivIVA domain-containing protein n=1 Tax=Propionicimonas paludicola TaxID=185243 RepID=A0A2A9CVH4_9ACTN|nr:DivIVA domain-containing protein [Propionicimonas paludicola]PFG18408.1 DivIVA domain-containing protein [Propionicimonas paludicola]
MIQIPGFKTVLRGYDPTEVDRAIGDLAKARDQARSEAADSAIESTKLQATVAQLEEQLSGYRTRLAAVEQNQPSDQPSFNDLGARIGRMLALAEDEADELKTRAKAEAERLSAEAEEAANQTKSAADRYARDVVSKADTEAARIVEAAKRQADEIVDYADREAVARREEAEAVYEHQRARAAAAAAEFERSLAERRDKAAEEFAAQMAANEQAINRAQERQVALEMEGDRALAEAKLAAESTIKAAREEAIQHVEAARLAALKIRRESERELQAATGRRDAINAQLANVRQMLATLGGTVASPLAELDEIEFAPIPSSAASPVETVTPEAADVVDESSQS